MAGSKCISLCFECRAIHCVLDYLGHEEVGAVWGKSPQSSRQKALDFVGRSLLAAVVATRCTLYISTEIAEAIISFVNSEQSSRGRKDAALE